MFLEVIMSFTDKLKRRINYYSSALASMRQYGGNAEVARGLARFALRFPSDKLRAIRWKLATKTISTVDSVVLQLDNFKLRVDAKDEGIAAELAIDKFHEPYGTKILQSILRDDMTIVDIGANIGYYVMTEATTVNVKQILAIEPNPVSYENIKANIELNACENIICRNVAASDENGSMPFYISKHSNICSLTPRTDYEKIIDVPVVKLDDLAKEVGLDKVDMVRMDIEGYEIHAIPGMMEILKRDRPWICMEYHSTLINEAEREVFVSTLENLGYKLKAFTFRWADMFLFDRTIADPRTVIKHGDLRTVLNDIPNQVLLLFLAPEETEYSDPEV